MKTIRILIADDHGLMRMGLTTLMRFHKDLQVVGGAENGEEAVRLARKLKPDVVVMDLMMPVLDGLEATRLIHREFPDIRIMILTTFGSSADVTRAVNAGACGALVKGAPNDELISAIRTIAAGGTAFSPEIETMLKAPQPPELTSRQREILEGIALGLASDAIAAKIGISADTVNQHLDAIRKKLGAANRTEAVAIALRKQLLKI